MSLSIVKHSKLQGLGFKGWFFGRNLIDAANLAALAALLSYRRPECTVGGDDGQQIIVHPPEVITTELIHNSFLTVTNFE